MAFIPYERITYNTKLNFEQIVKKINNAIEPKNNFKLFGSKSKKPFAGKLYNNIFKLSREISFTNLFTPVIYGAIIEEKGKITVRIKMTLHFIVKVVMAIWLSYVAYILFTSIRELIISSVLNDNLFRSLGVVVIGYVIMTWAFKMESGKVKESLEELFEAEIEK